MPLFSRTPAVDHATFCRLYYETQVFPVWEELLKGPSDLFVRVSEVDPAFRETDLEQLGPEVLALNLELFGLAWIHQLKDGERQVAESACCKA